MILSKEKFKEFEDAARPLIKWMAENLHPHTTAIVDSGKAELLEGVATIVTDKYIKD